MTDTPSNADLVAGLIRLLTVEKRAADVYAGPPQDDGVGRVFGGQVLAQALAAAQASVTDTKRAHSLHAYFLRGGREGAPIEYRIERDFDGRSFANRRVVASQESEEGIAVPILNLTASFQQPEDGLEHLDAPMPEVRTRTICAPIRSCGARSPPSGATSFPKPSAARCSARVRSRCGPPMLCTG